MLTAKKISPSSLISLFFILFFQSHLVFADSAKITVRKSQGDVVAIRAGQRVDLKEGDSLSPGDIIKTGSQSVVDVVWNKQWGYRLLSESECILEKTDKKDAVVAMTSGDIIANIEKLPEDGEFKVSTPTSIAGVRGTQFWGRVQQKGAFESTTFAVRKGVVEIKNKETGESITVEAGNALDVTQGEKTELRTATEEELGAIAQADQIQVSMDGA